MKNKKIAKRLGIITGLIGGVIFSSLIASACNNSKLESNVFKYIEIDDSSFKNDQRFNQYDENQIFEDFLNRMSIKRKIPKTKIKTEFEINKNIREEIKTNNDFAYKQKNIFVAQPNEIPAWYYDSFFSKDPGNLSYLFYKTKLENPKVINKDNQEKVLSYFPRTEVFNRSTQRFDEIYYRTPLYVQGWYVTHPLYDYDLQKGQIRELFQVAEPKNYNDEFQEIYLVAKYEGMKPTIAKKFNFVEYLNGSEEIKEDQNYEFEIEIVNKKDASIKQKQKFEIKTNKRKEPNVSYIEFEALMPGEYILSSLKLVNEPKVEYADKKDISLAFSLKVFDENEKIDPIVRLDLNTHMISDNLDDNKEILIDMDKLNKWFENPSDENRDYATISFKSLKELTPHDFDHFLRALFINQDDNYENIEMQYIIDNIDKENKKFDIKVKYINNLTKEEFLSSSLTFHYLQKLKNKQTSTFIYEEYNEKVKDWEVKLKEKLESIKYESINEETLNELISVTFSDLPQNSKTRTEIIKNNDRSLTLKIYSDKVYFDGKYFYDSKKDFMLAEVKINYFKINKNF